jgi:hypothetical protein
MPAAVDASKLKFLGMEKDKEQFRANMDAYLSQYPPGSPPMDQSQIDIYFSTDQYHVFRTKFWNQTTSVISGDESHFFSPPHIVKDLMKTPEKNTASTTCVPFSFSTLRTDPYPAGTESTPGGPVVGAIVSVTNDLKIASEAVAKAKTVRAKAEALQFLTDSQKDAFAAATSVAAQATKAGAPVITIGGKLPGIESVEPTEADVKTALSAMTIQDDGITTLDYFIQAYRAGDFPFYADYAVHRATEELAGPRQIVVTK